MLQLRTVTVSSHAVTEDGDSAAMKQKPIKEVEPVQVHDRVHLCRAPDGQSDRYSSTAGCSCFQWTSSYFVYVHVTSVLKRFICGCGSLKILLLLILRTNVDEK